MIRCFRRVMLQYTYSRFITVVIFQDNMWDCDDLVELSYRIMKNGLYMEYLNGFNRFLNYVELSFFNLQSKARAFEVGKKHYDIGRYYN